MHPRIRLLTCIATVLAGAGCATVGGLENAQGKGEISYYRADPESVFDASIIALSDLGLLIARVDEEARHAAAEAPAGLWSYGEVIGVFVRPSLGDSSVCAVEVVSRKRMATNLLAKNWETDVLDRLDAQFPTRTLTAEERGSGPPPAISRTELHDCLDSARRAGRIIGSRLRHREVAECREEGAGDSAAITACLERRREARVLAGKLDMEVLNACLREERRDLP